MFDELNKYKNNGHFFLNKGDNIKKASADAPDLPGVYYIVRLASGRIDLVYVGKTYAVMQNGKVRMQGLQDHFNTLEETMEEKDFFKMKFLQENIDSLDIYWAVTFDKKQNDLPGYVEGLIMQSFFDIHGCLPIWNKHY